MRRCAAAIVAVLAACGDTTADTADVSRVFIVPGAGSAPGVLYATFRNTTDTPDTLMSIASQAASSIALHATSGGSMTGLTHLEIPARSVSRLAPGAAHAMIGGLQSGLTRGDTVSVTFRLAHRGALNVAARVIGYQDVDDSVRTRGAH
jgi:copper(I)-binding protein